MENFQFKIILFLSAVLSCAQLRFSNVYFFEVLYVCMCACVKEHWKNKRIDEWWHRKTVWKTSWISISYIFSNNLPATAKKYERIVKKKEDVRNKYLFYMQHFRLKLILYVEYPAEVLLCSFPLTLSLSAWLYFKHKRQFNIL